MLGAEEAVAAGRSGTAAARAPRRRRPSSRRRRCSSCTARSWSGSVSFTPFGRDSVPLVYISRSGSSSPTITSGGRSSRVLRPSGDALPTPAGAGCPALARSSRVRRRPCRPRRARSCAPGCIGVLDDETRTRPTCSTGQAASLATIRHDIRLLTEGRSTSSADVVHRRRWLAPWSARPSGWRPREARLRWTPRSVHRATSPPTRVAASSRCTSATDGRCRAPGRVEIDADAARLRGGHARRGAGRASTTR